MTENEKKWVNLIMQNDKIAILMATYNGEKFIFQQLESILNQTYKNFDLIIRDDGSNDSTVSIIKRFKKKYNNIIFLKNNSSKHGQLLNFSILFNYAFSKKIYKYFMFSDQDDIWFKDKVEKSLNFIKKYSTPALVYTNYINFNTITNEKVRAYNKEIKCSFEKIFVQNWTMGCTYILNKPLIEKIRYIPLGVDNHDYYIALVASLDNHIYYLDEPTMVHRLHSENVTGRANSKTFSSRYLRFKKQFLNNNGRRKKYNVWKNVIKYLILLDNDNKHIIEIEKVMENSRLISIINALKNKFFGINVQGTLYFYIFLLCKPVNYLVSELNNEKEC